MVCHPAKMLKSTVHKFIVERAGNKNITLVQLS